MSETGKIEYYTALATDDDPYDGPLLDFETPETAIEAYLAATDETPSRIVVYGWQGKRFEMWPREAAEILVEAMEEQAGGPEFGHPDYYSCTISDDAREKTTNDLEQFFEAHPDVLKRASAAFMIWACEVVLTEIWVLVDGEYRREGVAQVDRKQTKHIV